jgi:hypothetical protein
MVLLAVFAQRLVTPTAGIPSRRFRTFEPRIRHLTTINMSHDRPTTAGESHDIPCGRRQVTPEGTGWCGGRSGVDLASGTVGEIFGRKGFGGFSVWAMANQAISNQARRAAWVAAAAAQEELARRTRANVEDLATFFVFAARERRMRSRAGRPSGSTT